MLWEVDVVPATTWTHLVGQVNEPPSWSGADVEGTLSACVKCKQPRLGNVVTPCSVLQNRSVRTT